MVRYAARILDLKFSPAYSYPSSVGVKNAGSYISTPTRRLHGVVLC